MVLVGQVWYLTPTWGCWGASALLCMSVLSLAGAVKQGTGRGVGQVSHGAWCVCIEESHADE